MMILSQYHIFELDTINIYSASTLTVYKLPSSSIYKYMYTLINFLKRLKRLKQECPSGTRQIDGNNLVWFGETERK
jgi:hypothetical protein